jgi:hypothetical protein
MWKTFEGFRLITATYGEPLAGSKWILAGISLIIAVQFH